MLIEKAIIAYLAIALIKKTERKWINILKNWNF